MRDSESSIDFQKIPWETIRTGGMVGRMKKHPLAAQRAVRILEISPTWKEKEWCSREHIGYVISGAMRIHFKSTKKRSLNIRPRQSFYVPLGLAHKASCRTTTTVFVVDRAPGA